MAVQAHFHCYPPLNNRHPKMGTSDEINFTSTSNSNSNSIDLQAETDAIIGFYNAKLRLGIGEIQKRHYTDIIRNLQNQAAMKIMEKDAQIEMLKRNQEELESRLKQMTGERQIWFTATKNSEAMVLRLNASLEQVLRRSGGGGGGGGGEGGRMAEDAASCCDEGDGEDRNGRRLCRACRQRDVSVLLLPCRHFCVCADCEPAAATCPICCAVKSVGLRVRME